MGHPAVLPKSLKEPLAGHFYPNRKELFLRKILRLESLRVASDLDLPTPLHNAFVEGDAAELEAVMAHMPFHEVEHHLSVLWEERARLVLEGLSVLVPPSAREAFKAGRLSGTWSTMDLVTRRMAYRLLTHFMGRDWITVRLDAEATWDPRREILAELDLDPDSDIDSDMELEASLQEELLEHPLAA